MPPREDDDRLPDRGRRSIGEVVAPIVKQLVVDAALKRLITEAFATKIVNSRIKST
jgi:hypothetical protein